MRFQRWAVALAAGGAGFAAMACGTDGIAGIPVTSTPTSASESASNRVSPAEWVSAVCGGYTAAFGSVPTEREVTELPADRLQQLFLDHLDAQQDAAEQASTALTDLGAPDIGSGGRQAHRDMIAFFDDLAANADRERQTIGKLDLASPEAQELRLVIVSAVSMNPSGLDIVEDDTDLDAAAQSATACTEMYEKLGPLLS